MTDFCGLVQLRQELLEAVAYGQQSLLEVSQLPEDRQLSSHSEASSDSGCVVLERLRPR